MLAHTTLRRLLLASLLTYSVSAHAIPPPDALLSLWQSALQFMGMGLALLAGAWFSVRQFFSQYQPNLLQWRTPMLWSLTGMVFCALLWQLSHISSPSAQAATALPQTNSARLMAEGVRATPPQTSAHPQGAGSGVKALPQGEMLGMDDVLKRESDGFVRNWKRKTLQDMTEELQQARQGKGLKATSLQTIASFTPAALAKLRQTQAAQLYFLDTREGYELSQFNIGYQWHTRYADLIYGALPNNLPKDKLIIVLCHSGLRGYLAANVLHQAGYANVAFLQGGLAAWSQAKLPVVGNENYSYEASTFKRYTKTQVQKLDAAIFQLDTDMKKIKGLKQAILLPIEITPSPEVEQQIKASAPRPVLLACQTYDGCFHTSNMAYWLKQKGRQVLGVYDASGMYLTGSNGQ